MYKIINDIIPRKIVNKIPFTWKVLIKYYFSKKKLPIISKDDLKVIVAIAADYGNLGDVAITSAQIRFLRAALPNHTVIPIYANEINDIAAIRKVVNPLDIITIIGGGNMGDNYEFFEAYRRATIELFPNNKIVSFPQTIDFSEDSKGIESLSKTIKVYSKHKNLHLFSRETKSYEVMKKYFVNNNVYLVPDIVLSLNKSSPEFKREGVILCLRDDIERKIPTEKIDSLLNLIINKYKKVNYYDTHIGNDFEKEMLNIELDKIWNSFKETKVVVTDRLHGMIFCAITKTPCVVLPNSNHKIAGTYSKWLADLDYIKFVGEFDEKGIVDSIDELYSMNLDKCGPAILDKQFVSLLNVLKNE